MKSISVTLKELLMKVSLGDVFLEHLESRQGKSWVLTEMLAFSVSERQGICAK